MPSLLDGISDLVSSSVLENVASGLGESQSNVSSAIGGLAATLLQGLVDKSTDGGAWTNIFSQLSGDSTDGFLDNLGGLIGGGNLAQGDPRDAAGSFIGDLFGDKVGPILSAITSFAGIKNDSSSGLLGLVGPLVMGYLGRRVKQGGLDALGLSSLLGGEKNEIAAAVPAQVAPILGLSAAQPAVSATVAPEPEGRSWLFPILAGIAAIAALLFFTRGCSDDGQNAQTSAPPPVAERITPAAVAEAGNPAVGEFVRDLNGFSLTGNADGVESKLISFIESGQEPCTEAGCWFTFDRLTFATGSASLDLAKSSAQLNNIAQILQAYPAIELKLGGYTDNTGSDATNMTLSAARAAAVVSAVSAMGVEATRMNAEGYGSQHPVASNDTPEGRAKNRRIDVRVRAR